MLHTALLNVNIITFIYILNRDICIIIHDVDAPMGKTKSEVTILGEW